MQGIINRIVAKEEERRRVMLEKKFKKEIKKYAKLDLKVTKEVINATRRERRT